MLTRIRYAKPAEEGALEYKKETIDISKARRVKFALIMNRSVWKGMLPEGTCR
jgi:hypothetical protein